MTVFEAACLFPRQFLEPLQKLRLRLFRRQRLQLHGREASGAAEDLRGFFVRKSGDLRRLEKGRRLVRALDDFLDRLRQFGGQSEAAVDRGGEAMLEGLVVEAERRLERADHVADHIFGRVMQQRREPPARGPARTDADADIVDEHAMLGHRKGVIAPGLPVPAGDAGKPMGNVRNLDVERRGVQKVEPPPAQHPLPRSRLVALVRHYAVPCIARRQSRAAAGYCHPPGAARAFARARLTA